MIVTTTPQIEGHAIREYKGIVFGEVVSGMDFLRTSAQVSAISSAAGAPATRKSSSMPGRTPWRKCPAGPHRWGPTPW